MKDWDPIEHTTQYKDDTLPCKLLALWQNPLNPKDIQALVHGCHFRTSRKHTNFDTVLFEFWRLAYHDLHAFLPNRHRDYRNDGTKIPLRQKKYLAPHLSWIRLENIVSRCLVVEEEPGLHEVMPETVEGDERNWVILVRKHELWSDQFT
jgi:hypothetical protein